MALFKSQVLTSASGSVGGLTYSRATGGMYMRARAVPVQPNTTFQQQVKAALTALVTRWTESLSDAERAAWNLYAANVGVLNALGDTIFLSGQNWYVAANTPRHQAETKLTATLPTVDSGPTIFDRGAFTTPNATASEATGLSVTLTGGDAWANEDNAAMLLFQGRPVNATRTFFGGPFRLVGFAAGSSITPPTGITAPTAVLATQGYAIAVGQKEVLAVAVTRADGRLSTRREIPLIVTA